MNPDKSATNIPAINPPILIETRERPAIINPIAAPGKTA